MLAVCTWGYAAAQTNGSSSTTTMSTTTVNTSSDANANEIIRKAAMMDVMEIEAGKLAAERATNPDVRAYGERLRTAHINSSKELKALAARRNINIPEHSRIHGAQGSAGNTAMSSSGSSLSGKYYSDVQVVQGNAASWAEHNPNNTTKSTAGTATNWTPGFKGKVGISTRNSGKSSSKATKAEGNSKSNSEHYSTKSDWDRKSDIYADATLHTDADISSDQNGMNTSNAVGTSSTRNTTSVSGSSSSGDLNNNSLSDDPIITYSSGSWFTIQPTSEELEDHHQKLNRLRETTGSDFDREYIQMMDADHEKAIKLYEDAAQSSDSEIREFANKMLPKLRMHHTEARNLKSSID